ncbi:MAG: hypothetical protein HC897_20450 [Thermoanaerobaculia bacterium]|nr:hypothetical protein [Thermoanaerobaculia bacterium]
MLLEEDPTRRVLVFQVSPSQHAHAFREPKGTERYWINTDSHTVAAKGELLHELLRRKGALPPFLEQACVSATLADIDPHSFETFVQSLGLPRSASEYLEPGAVIDSIARPLVVPVPASGSSEPRPTYLALLLFARDPVRFLQGAHVVLSVYSGASRTVSHSQRFDVTGPIPRLVQDVFGRLRPYTGMGIDKSADALSIGQNRPRYSDQVLQEALVNALAHRDYESREPTRVSIFDDRIEIMNPGGVRPGIDAHRLLAGKGNPSWRNPGLATFLLHLGLAQNLGQGLPKILEDTYLLAGRQPELHADAATFTVAIPARTPLLIARNGEAPPLASERDGLILVSIGGPSIRPSVERSSEELGLQEARVLVDFALPEYVDAKKHPWDVEARHLRGEIRAQIESPTIDRLHLFYRGPVALAPLLGALIAPVKPLFVYHFENGRYSLAYTLDRRFLRSSD